MVRHPSNGFHSLRKIGSFAMSQVFLSYAHEDRDRAKNLAHILEARGLTVWWDRKIVAGQTFDQVIEHELETAECVVVLWSPHSVASEWCKSEASLAAERGVLIPVMIDAVKLPLEFRRKQTADLSNWDNDPDHGGFQALVDGILAVTTGKLPPPRPTPPTRKKRSRRTWQLILAGSIMAILLIGIYWQAVVKKAPPATGTAAVTGAGTPGYRTDIFKQLVKEQYAAVDMLGKDRAQAIRLIDTNFENIDRALASFPDDPNFHALKGYAAKDVYQSSKQVLPTERRQAYLAMARQSFENALTIDPDNANAHNGMGNVLFFEGKFEEAIKQHTIALKLANGKYPAAEHDKRLVQRVMNGEIPFDF